MDDAADVADFVLDAVPTRYSFRDEVTPPPIPRIFNVVKTVHHHHTPTRQS